MRKIKLLMVLLVFPTIAFSAYNLWDFTDQGATHAAGGNFEVWGSFGKITCGKMSVGNYMLNGGFYYTGVEEISNTDKPTMFFLSQNYPNPFYSNTIIEYTIPKETNIEIKIYSIAGQVIKTIKKGGQKPGFYKVMWDGRDYRNKRVAPGIYFYRMEAEKFIATKKLTLLN